MIFISWLRKNWINRFSGLKHFNWTALIEWSKPAFFWLSYFNIKSAPHLSLIDHPVTARLGLSEVRTDTDGEYRDRAETDLTGDQRPAPAPQSQPQSSVCCFALWWWSLDLPRSRSQHALTSRLSSLVVIIITSTLGLDLSFCRVALTPPFIPDTHYYTHLSKLCHHIVKLGSDPDDTNVDQILMGSLKNQPLIYLIF